MAQTFTATTQNGTAIAADIWFRCYGVEPVTDYLAADLQAARQADGHLRVTDQLSLPDHPTVFAIGDITAIPEAKKAQAAAAHAQVVATNISSLIRGERDQASYQPHPPSISIPPATHVPLMAATMGLYSFTLRSTALVPSSRR